MKDMLLEDMNKEEDPWMKKQIISEAAEGEAAEGEGEGEAAEGEE